MTTLENFPTVSQLDGDINAQYDCVSASVAAGLAYLTRQSYTSAQVKDAAYGASYQGNTDPAQYVGYCAQHGVSLSSISGTDNTALITATKQQITQGNPVLLTEVDPYMPVGSGETHVIVAYACNSDSITVMDPYVAQAVTKTDQQWQSDLRSNQIWIMETTSVLTIDQVSQYFTDIGTVQDTRWHCKQTNQDIAYGILTYYRTCTATGLNGLSQFGLPLSAETAIPGVQGATYQVYERGVICYDPQHKVDSVPGISGPCYPAHIDKFLSQLQQNQPEPPVVVPNTQQAISTLQALLPAAQSLVPALQAVIKDLEPS